MPDLYKQRMPAAKEAQKRGGLVPVPVQNRFVECLLQKYTLNQLLKSLEKVYGLFLQHIRAGLNHVVDVIHNAVVIQSAEASLIRLTTDEFGEIKSFLQLALKDKIHAALEKELPSISNFSVSHRFVTPIREIAVRFIQILASSVEVCYVGNKISLIEESRLSPHYRPREDCRHVQIGTILDSETEPGLPHEQYITHFYCNGSNVSAPFVIDTVLKRLGNDTGWLHATCDSDCTFTESERVYCSLVTTTQGSRVVSWLRLGTESEWVFDNIPDVNTPMQYI